MNDCQDTRLLLGSYTLGGLEYDEAALVERHLRICQQCRATYERLAPLPAMLELVEPFRPAADPPPAPLDDSVHADFMREPGESDAPAPQRPRSLRRGLRQLRLVVPSALAGAALAVAVLAVTGALLSGPESGTTVALGQPVGAGDLSATARVAESETGTEVELDARLAPLRAAELYELWFVRGGGRVSAGTFTVDRDGRAKLRLATAARSGEYRRIGITREPDGLDPARNGPSVVVGSLAS
jgi:anti-sigma factor RsiW